MGFEQRVRSRRVDVSDQEALEIRGAQVSPSYPPSTHRLFKHDPLGPRHRYNKHPSVDDAMQLGFGWSEVVLKLSPDCSIGITLVRHANSHVHPAC